MNTVLQAINGIAVLVLAVVMLVLSIRINEIRADIRIKHDLAISICRDLIRAQNQEIESLRKLVIAAALHKQDVTYRLTD